MNHAMSGNTSACLDAKDSVTYVGSRIKHLRESRNMTQDDLATKFGATGNCESRYEMGTVTMGIDKFFTIAMALGVTPNDLCPPFVLCGTSFDRCFYRLNEHNKRIVKEVILALLAWQELNP